MIKTLVMLASMCSPANALAAAPPPLPPGGVYAALGRDLRIQNACVTAWTLESPGPAHQVAAWLSRSTPALRDLHVMAGTIILSGVANERLWVARLYEAGRGRTAGTLSTMSLAPPVHPLPAAAPLWHPPGARLRFVSSLPDADDAARSQRVWTHSVPPGQLWPRLLAALRDAGWNAAHAGLPNPLLHGYGVFRRGVAQLQVVVTAAGAGSGIVTIE